MYLRVLRGYSFFKRLNHQGHEGSRKKAQEFARQCLQVYNAWLSGDCYGVVTDVFEVDVQGNAKCIDSDSVWGYMGTEDARSSLKEVAACRAAGVQRDILVAA